MKAFDIIGDIHGHADELEALLKQMGYQRTSGVYKHPERTALFIGDLIDRGPYIKRTIDIVRRMRDGGNAICLMGNHEFNAICFSTLKEEGAFLREHSEKNRKQIAHTLGELGDPLPDDIISFFYSLPLFHENEHFRAVHACWDDAIIHKLQEKIGSSLLTEEHIFEAGDEGLYESDPSSLFNLLEVTLKGKEIELPDDSIFKDKDGHKRSKVRTRWFENSTGKTYRTYSFPETSVAPETLLPPEVEIEGYPETEKPVFFGHYWLDAKSPSLLRNNICCVDYSVAKGGFLCGYRFSGEPKLSNKNLISHILP